MLSTEELKRQIAVVVVVAMEKASFLLTVQRQIRGIHVQHDLRRSLRVGFDE
jgi:hypothetical protein